DGGYGRSLFAVRMIGRRALSRPANGNLAGPSSHSGRKPEFSGVLSAKYFAGGTAHRPQPALWGAASGERLSSRDQRKSLLAGDPDFSAFDPHFEPVHRAIQPLH